jgi:hypothetical protein
MTFAVRRNRGLAWRCPLNVPRCSAPRRVVNWLLLLDFGIHVSSVRSSAPRLVTVTSRRSLCWVRFRAHTLLLAHSSRSFSRTQGGGRTRYGMPGADVVMNERAGSHDGAFWREEFPLMVAWAFGR